MSIDMDKPGESSTSTIDKSQPDTIPLYLINGVATIWDAQTAATIHCLHAISGLRVGTLPGVSQQNAFLGLPITLTPEETAHLLNLKLVHLVTVPNTPRYPTDEEVRVRREERVRAIRCMEEKRRVEVEGRKREGKERFEKSGEAARAKREERARLKAEKNRLKAQVEREGDSGGLFGEEEEVVKVEMPKELNTPVKQEKTRGSSQTKSTVSNSGYFHTVPSHPVLPPIQSSHSKTLPHFPRTTRDHALIKTFTTLHTLGLRLGLGPRFGGEYLIYPGDYLRYHAHFTSQVIVRDEMIRPGEIVAWGRLGTGTKKAGLLCCWDDGVRVEAQDGAGGEEVEVGKGEVEFYSLEWANFG